MAVPLATAQMMRVSELTVTTWKKIDAHYQPQECSSWTLLSDGIRLMRIYVKVPW